MTAGASDRGAHAFRAHGGQPGGQLRALGRPGPAQPVRVAFHAPGLRRWLAPLLRCWHRTALRWVGRGKRRRHRTCLRLRAHRRPEPYLLRLEPTASCPSDPVARTCMLSTHSQCCSNRGFVALNARLSQLKTRRPKQGETRFRIRIIGQIRLDKVGPENLPM